ncbi:hypothetical protein R1flu_024193 [Riccia fluitans]|uniref:Uncharacterized protein n=1 Tax=Riccia fluitans TaxID=41844 RepID=A0ABD1XU74_9MARC
MVHQETTPNSVSRTHDVTKITGERLLPELDPASVRVKNQRVNIPLFSSSSAGAAVTLSTNLDARQHHGVIYFPWWVHLNGSQMALFQHHHLREMMRLRDSGSIVANEFADLWILVDDIGVDNEDGISLSPSPTEFAPHS